MFCRKCGNRLGDQAKFCSSCGESVHIEVDRKISTSENQPRPVYNFWRSYLKTTVITTVVLSVIFGFMGAFAEEALGVFLGVLILSAMLSVLFTIFTREHKQASEPINEEDKKKYGEMGGWLLILGLGLVVTAVYNIFSFVEVFQSTENYAGTWLFMYDFIGMGIAACYSSFVVYLFFKKKKIFPKNFVYLYSYLVLFNTATIILLNAYSVPQDQMQDYYQNAGRTAVGLLIWGLYVTKSKRVRVNFVNE